MIGRLFPLASREQQTAVPDPSPFRQNVTKAMKVVWIGVLV